MDRTEPTGGFGPDALDLLDWRRRVFALYAEVRALKVKYLPLMRSRS